LRNFILKISFENFLKEIYNFLKEIIMGASNVKPKKGVLYSEIRQNLKPFDLLLFKGGDFVSDFIRSLQKLDLENPVADNFSHVGIVITSDVLDYEYIKAGKIYILESAVSGRLGQKLKTVEGKSHLGVILRDFDELIEKYDKSNRTRIAYAPLLNNPVDTKSKRKLKKLKRDFTRFFHTINNQRYDLNPLNLISVISSPITKPIRIIRDVLGIVVKDTEDWIICSALVAKCWQFIGVLPMDIDCKYTYPTDLLGIDQDGLPLVIKIPPTYIITKRHYSNEFSNLPNSEDNEYL